MGEEEEEERLNKSPQKQRRNIFARATSGQEGLYVIWKQDPAANNYNVGLSVDANGVENERWYGAVVGMVAKHSALRTRSFFMKSGKTVLQEVGWKVEEEMDWRTAELESREEAELAMNEE